jgi:hypothetical protein
VRIRTLIGLTVAAAMALVLATPISVSAQTPPPAPQTQAQPPQTQPPAAREAAQPLRSPVEGDLVSVDPDAKKVTVKPMTGANLVFTYSDTTEISGAQKDAAGLATLKEGKVTIHFTEDPATKARTATRIIVAAKK